MCLLSASIQTIFPGPLHYLAMNCLKAPHLRAYLSYDHPVCLDLEVQAELHWWLRLMDACNGKATFGATLDFILESNTSLLGWGATHGDAATSGLWTSEESHLPHQLLRVDCGVVCYSQLRQEPLPLLHFLRMDNISTLHYINRLSGVCSQHLSDLTRELYQFCFDRNISLLEEYLPGSSNFTADWFFRYWRDSRDWRLDSYLFSCLANVAVPFI